MKRILKRGAASFAVVGLLQPTLMAAALANTTPSVTVQPNLNSTVSPYALNMTLDPVVSNNEMIRLIRNKVKYVFVIFNENNSFDHEYGTFPGVNGIYNSGSGNARSFADLASAVYRALGKEPKIEYVDTPPEIRDKYQYFTEAKMERLRAAGYDRPATALEQGVKHYVQTYLAGPDAYR